MAPRTRPFYCRFADPAELPAAIMEFWQRDFTVRLIEHSAPLQTPRARLEDLLNEALAVQFGSIDVARLGGALRAAVHPETVSRAVCKVDTQRIDHLTGDLAAMGALKTQAQHLAWGYSAYSRRDGVRRKWPSTRLIASWS